MGQTRYMVTVEPPEAHMKVCGRAGYLNCMGVADFFAESLKKGVKKLVVDFAECDGMDSTFLGMLAGAALKLRRVGGALVLVNMNTRNTELAENLGLENICEISRGESETGTISGNTVADTDELANAAASAKSILSAHESLADIDQSNRAKFEDVLTYLRKQTDSES